MHPCNNSTHIIYWIFVSVGAFFRYDLMRYTLISNKEKIKKIISEIIGIGLLTFLWSSIKSIEKYNPHVTTLIMLISLGYCLKKLIKKCPEGHTESLLLIVNTFFVTTLSFIGFPYCIPIALSIIVLSVIIYRKWPFEVKSDFYEIVILCCEAIIISIITAKYGSNKIIVIATVVLFVETALQFIHCLLMCIIKKLCHEDMNDYIDKLHGIN